MNYQRKHHKSAEQLITRIHKDIINLISYSLLYPFTLDTQGLNCSPDISPNLRKGFEVLDKDELE